MKVGLRIDVDTYNGTRDGVPALLGILNRYDIQSTFFFSVGPDNMGRHLWRLLKPHFLVKMLRSKAGSLYGWDILLRGAFWPGPDISGVLKSPLEKTKSAGHEVGLHAFDHQYWQKHAAGLEKEKIARDLRTGSQIINDVIGVSPIAFAAPGWRGTDDLLLVEPEAGFLYGSDCRGGHIFRPVIDGKPSAVPQIPVTLPTYDEVIGRNGLNEENYNEYIFSLLNEDSLNVLTIHAEVEGISKMNLFREFLSRAVAEGITFLPLGRLLPKDVTTLPPGLMKKGKVPGREGWVAVVNDN